MSARGDGRGCVRLRVERPGRHLGRDRRGSALVWVVWSPDGAGQGAQLRAPTPCRERRHAGGAVQRANLGAASKFNPPGMGQGRVYVGTREGKVYGFGAPVNQPLVGIPVNLGTVNLGKSSSGAGGLHR